MVGVFVERLPNLSTIFVPSGRIESWPAPNAVSIVLGNVPSMVSRSKSFWGEVPRGCVIFGVLLPRVVTVPVDITSLITLIVSEEAPLNGPI